MQIIDYIIKLLSFTFVAGVLTFWLFVLIVVGYWVVKGFERIVA